jgi:hypothetical protein
VVTPIPMTPSRLHIIYLLAVEEKNAERLDVWQEGSLSITGRTTLLNSSITNTLGMERHDGQSQRNFVSARWG